MKGNEFKMDFEKEVVKMLQVLQVKMLQVSEKIKHKKSVQFAEIKRVIHFLSPFRLP